MELAVYSVSLRDGAKWSFFSTNSHDTQKEDSLGLVHSRHWTLRRRLDGHPRGADGPTRLASGLGPFEKLNVVRMPYYEAVQKVTMTMTYCNDMCISPLGVMRQMNG